MAVAPPEFWTATGLDSASFASVDIAACIGNQIPVLLGNLVGGAVFEKSPSGSVLTGRGKFLDTYARRILALSDQIMAYSGAAA